MANKDKIWYTKVEIRRTTLREKIRSNDSDGNNYNDKEHFIISKNQNISKENLEFFHETIENDDAFYVKIDKTMDFMVKSIELVESFYLKNYNQSASKSTQIQESCPPSILIDALIAPDLATDMQANLADLFPRWIERHGIARTRWIHSAQIVRMIVGEYWNKALDLIKAIKLAGS